MHTNMAWRIQGKFEITFIASNSHIFRYTYDYTQAAGQNQYP